MPARWKRDDGLVQLLEKQATGGCWMSDVGCLKGRKTEDGSGKASQKYEACLAKVGEKAERSWR